MDDNRPIVTVGIIEAKPERVAQVEDALRAAVRAAHSEAGCHLYALHRTGEDPVRFVMIEQWSGPAALAAHLAGDGIQALMPALAGNLAGPPLVLRLAALPEGDTKLGQLAF